MAATKTRLDGELDAINDLARGITFLLEDRYADAAYVISHALKTVHTLEEVKQQISVMQARIPQ